MDYKMRALETDDIYAMSEIISKLGIKLEIQGAVTQQQVGAQLLMKAISNLHLAKPEVNKFLAELVDIEPKKFGKLPLKDTFKIISLFKEQDGVADFLEQASK